MRSLHPLGSVGDSVNGLEWTSCVRTILGRVELLKPPSDHDPPMVFPQCCVPCKGDSFLRKDDGGVEGLKSSLTPGIGFSINMDKTYHESALNVINPSFFQQLV